MAVMPNGMTTGGGEVQEHEDPIADLITPGGLLSLAYAWSSISKDQLVKAGVIGQGVGGSDWKRFNDDPMTFIMKLPPDRLPALCRLLS